jgi:hypothetical protein
LGRAIIIDSKNYIYAIIERKFGYIEKNKPRRRCFYFFIKNLPPNQAVNSTLWSAGVNQ